jgi:hypothetical protein
MRRISLFALLALMAATMPAHAQPSSSDDLTPKLIKPQERDPRAAEAIQKNIDTLKDLFDKIKTITHGKVDPNTPIDIGGLKDWGLKNPGVDITGMLQTALNLMEAYGYIDPREDLIQPDLNPRGMPELASRAVKDPNLSPEEYGAFRKLTHDIDAEKNFLEKNYVVLKQTEIKTKRLADLANSAANMSGIAGVYWAKVQGDPNDPMNKSKAAFYDKYDGAQANGLKALNDTLKAMGDFELKNYGDRNWYLYFGLPYYNFMAARYTRP